MKQIITIIALVMVFATSTKAQIVGATSESQSPKQNTYSNANLFQNGQQIIKKGNKIFFIGLGVSAVAEIINDMGYLGQREPYLGLMGGGYIVIGALASAAIATPFWISGARMKRQANSISYIPLIQQDFRLNKDLTLTTSIGTSNYTQIVPVANDLQTNGLSIGFSLNF